MIDTVYEYAGYSLAALLRGVVSGAGLPLLVGAAGTAWLFHEMSSERASPRQLLVHLLSLILAWWLLSPARGGEIAAPRLAVWLGQATDQVQTRAIRAVNARFLDSPLAWERLSAMAAHATILDPALRKDVADFLEACATPALAMTAPVGDDLLADGALPYDAACARRRSELRGRISRHLETDPLHRAALETAAAHDPPNAAAFRARYEAEACRRAVDDPGSPLSEGALLAAALGTYSYTDAAQSTGAFPRVATGLLAVPDSVSRLWDWTANLVLSAAGAFQQSLSQRLTAKQTYFTATAYAPHLYGLSLLFLLGLLPVAGLWALWPGKWTALANWAKIFASLKMWPLGWAILTSFNARRSALEAFDPGPRGSGDAFLAVSAFYVLVPTLSFLVVHLGVKAAASPFAAAVPGPAGPPRLGK